jgi:hypothetical protein
MEELRIKCNFFLLEPKIESCTLNAKSTCHLEISTGSVFGTKPKSCVCQPSGRGPVPGPRHVKKMDLPGRGLTKGEKHCLRGL